jgi:hypothetical protein
VTANSQDAQKPQPSTVLAEPATPDNCAADYADRTNATGIHPSSYDAQPHTLGRR